MSCKIVRLCVKQEEKERREQEEQRKKLDDDAKKKKVLTNMTQQYTVGQKVWLLKERIIGKKKVSDSHSNNICVLF